MRRGYLSAVAAVLVIGFGFAACGGRTAHDVPCSRGQERSCSCPGGERGVQGCIGDGPVWDDCRCDGAGGAGGSPGGGTGGMGGGGGVGGSGGVGVCARACQSLAAANCPATGLSECMAECEEYVATYAYCSREYDLALGCLASLPPGAWYCDRDGEAVLSAGFCEAEVIAAMECELNSSGGSGGGPSVCTHGQTRACACPDGRLGAQICDGYGWAPCECGMPAGGTGGGWEPMCVLGEARSCVCPEGMGIELCDGYGWTPCDCSMAGGGTGGVMPCPPGVARSCLCPDGLPGVQQCDGYGWGPCECGMGPAGAGGVLNCPPGLLQPCICSDGRPGAQVCLSSGLGWGACDCGTPVGGCGGLVPVGGSYPLIDDLEDGDNAIAEVDSRVGFWYTYNDLTPGARQEPLGEFLPVPGGANGTRYSARTWGEGFVDWGAGMGFHLNNVGGTGCPYDASAFDGISFFLKGSGMLRVNVTTTSTTPVQEGGNCDTACYDFHGRDYQLTNSWTLYEIWWSELYQQGWGAPAAFNPAQIIGVHFQVQPGAPFDIYVDELNFFWTDA